MKPLEKIFRNEENRSLARVILDFLRRVGEIHFSSFQDCFCRVPDGLFPYYFGRVVQKLKKSEYIRFSLTKSGVFVYLQP